MSSVEGQLREALEAAQAFIRIPGQYPKHGPSPEYLRLRRAVEALSSTTPVEDEGTT